MTHQGTWKSMIGHAVLPPGGRAPLQLNKTSNHSSAVPSPISRLGCAVRIFLASTAPTFLLHYSCLRSLAIASGPVLLLLSIGAFYILDSSHPFPTAQDGCLFVCLRLRLRPCLDPVSSSSLSSCN